MNTKELNYANLIANAETVDTTTGTNGYPQALKVAYTADKLSELETLKEAAEAAGHEVEVVSLHRRDGWRLWERSHVWGIDGVKYMNVSESDTTVTLTEDSDHENAAFDLIIGDNGESLTSLKDLEQAAKDARRLADEFERVIIASEPGERTVIFMDMDNRSVDYSVTTDQNGYEHDTHHYKTGLLITEKADQE